MRGARMVWGTAARGFRQLRAVRHGRVAHRDGDQCSIAAGAVQNGVQNHLVLAEQPRGLRLFRDDGDMQASAIQPENDIDGAQMVRPQEDVQPARRDERRLSYWRGEDGTYCLP